MDDLRPISRQRQAADRQAAFYAAACITCAVVAAVVGWSVASMAPAVTVCGG